MDWFAGGMVPFTVALLALAAIVVLELVGTLTGQMPSGALDGALDLDTDIDAEASGFGAALGWLGVGRVPVVALLMAFLASFGLAGATLQGVSAEAFGGMLPSWLAALPALVAGLFGTRTLGVSLACFLPGDESEASEADGFIGRRARLGAQTAKAGQPAEAKLTDEFGQTHYVRVEPQGGETFAPGASVILTAREGAVFTATADTTGPGALSAD